MYNKRRVIEYGEKIKDSQEKGESDWEGTASKLDGAAALDKEAVER